MNTSLGLLSIDCQPIKNREIKIEISGYKHAMVAIIASSIAQNHPVRILNAPLVTDTYVLSNIIKSCGGIATLQGNELYIDPSHMLLTGLDDNLTSLIHGTIYLIPAYAARFGKIHMGPTGGCTIGAENEGGKRPVTHILKTLEYFGYEGKKAGMDSFVRKLFEITDVCIDINEFSSKKFGREGPHISGATKTALIAATKTKSTKIFNPYFKTDVRDLLRFLGMCGIDINATHDLIQINNKIFSKENNCIDFSLTSCVSEVITYITLGQMTGCEITLSVSRIDDVCNGLYKEFELLNKMGIDINVIDNTICIEACDTLNSVDIVVDNDSIQSDHLPFFALLLTKANKPSILIDKVWGKRFAYLPGFEALGIRAEKYRDGIKIMPGKAVGTNKLLELADTRAGAIVTLAAISSGKMALLRGTQHIDRGYNDFYDNILKFGVKVKRFYE